MEKAGIAVVVLVLGGIGVYAFRAAGPDSGRRAQAKAVADRPAAGATAAGGAAPDAASAVDSKAGRHDQGAWAKLSEKYGGSRTNLSKKVTTDIADVLDDSLGLADMGAQMTGSQSAAEAAGKQMVRGLAGQLGLTEEQQANATDLVKSAVEQRLAAVKELASAMRDDPGAMMEMLLAGDAVSRGEMTQAEYDEVTGDTRAMIENVGGFVLGRTPDRLGYPLFGDEEFNSQLAAILTPDQQQQMAQYAADVAARQQSQPDRPNLPLQNGNIPVMELEKFEQTVASAKQMAGGLRQLMEGMQGIQQNLPTEPGSN